MSRPKRYSLAIELTSYCNQKCGYCYNDWREDGGSSVGSLPSDKLLELVDKALTEVEFDHVTLTGGEPMARKDFFEVLDVCKKHNVGVQIISNGGLATEAIAQRLAPYDLRFVQVSLNGITREQHEEHVGEGHYDKTLAGIAHLQAHRVPVVGCIVVTRKNARDLYKILEHFRALKINSIALSRYSPAGYAAKNVAELLPSRSEMLEALRQAEEHGKTHGTDLQVTMPVPLCVVDHAEYPHIRFGGCPIGTEMQEFALGPTGELRNCTLHTESLGNGSENSFAELIVSPGVSAYRDLTPEFCEPCRFRQSCLGGCGAAAISVLGDRTHVDPFVAQHVEEPFRLALKKARSGQDGFVPASALRRSTANPTGV